MTAGSKERTGVIVGRTVKAVRQDDAQGILYLDFEDGTTLIVPLKGPDAGIMVREKHGIHECAVEKRTQKPTRSPRPPQRKPRANIPRRVLYPTLEIEQILAWADAYYARTGKWPTDDSGRIREDSAETWANINAALYLGLRGLTGGSSIARLLAQYRGKRNRKALPSLTEEQILAWADAYRARTGKWPPGKGGPIADAPGETWTAVGVALRNGIRGLPGGSSTAKLLEQRRGVRHPRTRPRFTTANILRWADAHHARTGKWPGAASGPIAVAPEETWRAVDKALTNGNRGLPGGSSLTRLLAAERGVRNRMALPRLTEETILCWADAHHERTGQWPKRAGSVVTDAPEEIWARIDNALHQGGRGLPGDSSLARLLLERRGVRHRLARPKLSVEQILAWADAFHARHGRWPAVLSGPIEEAPEESWSKIEAALNHGSRGLPGNSSLARLLKEHRAEG